MHGDVGVRLLNELSKVWDDKLHLSLVQGGDNDKIIKTANNHFEVITTYVTNSSTDQIGFFHSLKKNKEDTDYILYLHDTPTWEGVLEESIAIFLNPPSLAKSLKSIRNDPPQFAGSKVGIVAAGKTRQKTEEFPKVLVNNYDLPLPNRAGVVRSLQTIVWLKELQNLMAKKYGILSEKNHYPPFAADCFFLLRRDVAEVAHVCLHDKHFEEHSRSDGNVEHGLERFYFYVSLALNYVNVFWGHRSESSKSIIKD